MSRITNEDVQAIANLARLGIPEGELMHATADLTGVLDHFSRLQSISTIDVPVSSDMAGLKNITREDVAEREALCSADDVLSRAAASSDRLVKTPTVRT